MRVAESVQCLCWAQTDDAFLVMFDCLLDISQFLVAKSDVIVAEAEPVWFIHLMELCICLFEFGDGLLELNVVHEEVAFDMIEVRMNDGIAFENIVDVL